MANKFKISRYDASATLMEIKDMLMNDSKYEMTESDIEAFDMAIDLIDYCCPYHSIEGFKKNGAIEHCTFE